MTKKDTSLDDIAVSINDLATMVGDQFLMVKDQFEQVDKRFEQVDNRFEQVDKRFEQVDKRFEQVDKRFEQVDNRFSKLESMAYEHSAQIKELQHSNAQIIDRLDDLEGRLIALENDIKEIYIMIANKQDIKSPIKKLKGKNLEQYVIETYVNILQIAKDAHIKLPN